MKLLQFLTAVFPCHKSIRFYRFGGRKSADPQSELNLQKALLLYLERNGHLSDLIQAGKNFVTALTTVRERGSCGQPLCFQPELDLTLITQISGNTANMVLNRQTGQSII